MRFTACFFILILFVVNSSNADIHHVPDEYSTIQEGINAAMDGDTVIVAPGIYVGSGNQEISFLGKAILVTSEIGPENTVIADGFPIYDAFTFTDNEITSSILRGFTITNFVRGIVISYSSPYIVNCIITECGAAFGDCGGIQIDHSDAIIDGCQIYYCYNGQHGTAAIGGRGGTILNTAIFWNGDNQGGGVVGCADMLFINCVFYQNGPFAIEGLYRSLKVTHLCSYKLPHSLNSVT